MDAYAIPRWLDVRLSFKADIALCNLNVRFVPLTELMLPMIQCHREGRPLSIMGRGSTGETSSPRAQHHGSRPEPASQRSALRTRRQPLRIATHPEVDFARRAGYAVLRRSLARKHLARIVHALTVETFVKTVVKGVHTEITPEIPATTKNPAVPIDLRAVPQLVTDTVEENLTRDSLVFVAGRIRQAGLLPNEIGVNYGRELRIPGQLRMKVHLK